MANKKSNKGKRFARPKKTKLSNALKALESLTARERKSIINKLSAKRGKSGTRKRATSARKKPKLPPYPKSNIVKRRNKSGNTFYYNKRTHRFSSSDSWKKSRARIRKRIEQIKKIKAKKPRALTKWNILQRAVARHVKENKLKLKNEFNSYVKKIYDSTKNIDAGTLDDNIDVFFQNHSGYTEELPEGSLKFRDDFYFYDAADEFKLDLYDNITIGVTLDDRYNDFSSSFKGLYDDFLAWYYSSGTFNHLRRHYSDSPPAKFLRRKTDGKTFVDYIINIDGEEGEELHGIITPDEPIPDPISNLPLTSKPSKRKEAKKLSTTDRSDLKEKSRSVEDKYEKKLTEYIKSLGSIGVPEKDAKGIPYARLKKKEWKLRQNQSDFIYDLVEKGMTKEEVSAEIRNMNIKSLSKIMQEDIKFIDDMRKQGFSDAEIKKEIYPS